MMLTFNNLDEIKKAGFAGFNKISQLYLDSSAIPRISGIYCILNVEDKPDFLEYGTGGYFKGKNPNIAINELKEKWVDSTIVVYLGKAGKEGSKVTLQSRLKQ